MANLDKQQIVKEITLTGNESILFALKRMDVLERKLLIVVHENKFIGLLSIGDIQRAILKNINLESSIKEILRDDLTLAYSYENPDLIRARMMEYRTEIMPVLDRDNNLLDILFWEDVIGTESRTQEKLDLPVIIMAGGKGERLKPLTNVFPKPLIPVNEKTILEDIMDQFVNIGCHNFYLSVNYKADIIKQFLAGLDNPNYNLSYFQEDKPLGTAGSLYLIADKIKSTFFVSNCDIIIHQDLVEVYNYHKQNGNSITMIAALKHYKIPYGTIETGIDGILEELQEKPELTFKINSGVYILEPDVLKNIPKNKFFHITDLILKIKKNGGKIGVFPISEKSWLDYGLMENLPFFNKSR